MLNRLLGVLYLIASILWVILVIPVSVLAALYKLLTVFDNNMGMVITIILVIIAIGAFALAVVLTGFGLSLIRSSWRTIKGYGPEREMTEQQARIREMVKEKLTKE